MQRIANAPRHDWKNRVEQELGFIFHSPDGDPYWTEDAHYVLTAAEVDLLDDAGVELHRMCIEACRHVIQTRQYAMLGIPEWVYPAIKWSWDRFEEKQGEEMPIYGRFDIAWNGVGSPKMLEYNASTPTSLYETSVVQWDWLEKFAAERDQFNSMHEMLVERWRQRARTLKGKPVHFTAQDNPEDMGTLSYMQACAVEAGIPTKIIPVDQLVYDKADRCFYDGATTDAQKIEALFTLYPPEWLIQDQWGKELVDAIVGERLILIEPIWKMLLTKGILPILWELNPFHDNLLKTSFNRASFHAGNKVVAKPLWGREGDGVEIATLGPDGQPTGTVIMGDRGGENAFAGKEGWVYQEHADLFRTQEGGYAVFGIWMIGDKACGLGVREDQQAVTGNTSRYVPHLFD